MIRKGSGLLFFFMVWITTGFAQQIDFKASAVEEASVGQQFRLIYSINGQASGFRAPAIKDFSILGGPSQSSSTNMQIINGKVSRSIEYTYTYLLQAINEGTFTIPPAAVTVDGKTYQSNPVTIRVVKGSQQATPGGSDAGSQPSGEISSRDLYVTASASKTNPYQGEQVIITYRIYTRIPIAQYSITRLPSMAGFWSQDLIKDNDKLNQYREIINGSEYVIAEIKKNAVFAQKSGQLNIEPLELDVVAQIQRKKARSRTMDPFFDNFFNDSFFGSTLQNVKKTLKSNGLTINVKPLPSASRPREFSGAVGDFKVEASVDQTQMKTNDAASLKFTISGKGNLKLVEKPVIDFPPDFEIYDPRITDNIQTTASGISGSRTFEFLMIPRNPGDFTIKPIEFAWFDPNSGSYRKVSTESFKIKVEKGSGDGEYVSSASSKEDIKYIGSDIRFIKTGNPELRRVDTYFFNSTGFWLWLLLPPVLFIAFLIFLRKELKRRSNIALVRNKKATRVARKRLKKAEYHLKLHQSEPFWIEVSNALWGYLSDKFNIPLSKLSMESVNDALMAKNVNPDLIDQFIRTVSECEFARFAPGDKTQAMEALYHKALDVITRTEQELK
ncbi:MAG: BatD family protein [Lentimicrobiaceae bacterium]|nr:BatD family protein [Lentimicrobiaceae bacterium]MDD4596977.1 BatD family protein [Lentimicrobiaceae bacterium]MDY0026897.1 BatD family protein [Lentimicrobium sp.]HAH57245.1 BatD protein [Bacteroidales bacterium]